MTHRSMSPRRHHRQRGVAAILAMMFLVIFGSLAAAMAIVAQGNLVTADSHLKINRALAGAETGMRFTIFQLSQAARNVTTRDGLIDETNAPALWDQTRAGVITNMIDYDAQHTIASQTGTTLTLFDVPIGEKDDEVNAVVDQRFTATLTPHPIVGEDYDSAYYQRAPYSDMDPPVSSAAPLDATWIRVRVTATDGTGDRQVTRSIQMDFRLEKKIKYAILSKSRVMVGRNVMIDGPIGSRFLETWVPNGHPIQMESNFRGLDVALDTALDGFVDNLILYDQDGDNRINLNNPSEAPSDPFELTALQDADANADGYLDDYDYFLGQYDTDDNGILTATELDTANNPVTAELLELIDTFGDPYRTGYGDNVIDENDSYVKIKGEIHIKAGLTDWETGAADPNGDGTGSYRDYLQGAIDPSYRQSPIEFSDSSVSEQEFGPADFDMSSFKSLATGVLEDQATTQAALNDPADPSSPQPLGIIERESVPYGAAHPYDYYDRPVYENMTFTNVKIPAGSNAVFKNCTFIGVTFVETNTANTDANFNYAGMMEADGTLKHPDVTATVGGTTIADTKTISNNVRFDNCTFEGSVVSDAPPAYTHVRNKVAFTGTTNFRIDDSAHLSDIEKELFRRSTILTPHYSVEMGTFTNPTDSTEQVSLTGTIVAGVLDMRGRIKIDGQILTTFEPQSFVAPVVDDNSPFFNTTLGYFGSDAGDLEAELPGVGMGMIQLVYNEDLALPDGILAPIQLTPMASTYFEGGAD